MNGRGSIVYVHGAGDREAEVGDHVARIEEGIGRAGLQLDVVASRWGELAGADLSRIELALPPLPPRPTRDATAAPEPAMAELAALASTAQVEDASAVPPPVGQRESDVLLDICRVRVGAANETIRLVSGELRPLTEACRVAAVDVAGSPEYRRARASGVPEGVLVAAVGRAVAATVAAEAGAPADVFDTVHERIAEAVLAAAVGTILVGYAGLDVGQDLKRWATDVLLPRRAELIRRAGRGPADVVLYQRNGGAIRQVVARSIADALARGRPVVALGNSLGGIVLVDTLSRAGAPRPDLLVTVGTQAPLLATFGALHPIEPGEGAALFTPWVNVHDRRDLLAFVGERVWPGQRGIEDRQVDMGLGFPDSHGASYLSHPPLYRIIAEHPALSGAAEPLPARRFPIRLGKRSRPVLWLFGVNQGNAHVDLDDHLDARFGFFRLRTPVSNVARWRIEGPWRWLTAIGVRRGIRHGDVTFGGNHEGGVRLDFHERVPWWGTLRAPALYVTVADLEGLGRALAERGIAGEDARQASD